MGEGGYREIMRDWGNFSLGGAVIWGGGVLTSMLGWGTYEGVDGGLVLGWVNFCSWLGGGVRGE